MHDESSHRDLVSELLALAGGTVAVEALDEAVDGVRWWVERAASVEVTLGCGPVRVRWRFGRVDHPFFDNLPSARAWPGGRRVRDLVAWMGGEAERRAPGWRTTVEGLGRALLVAALRELAQHDPTYRTPMRVPSVYRAIQWIHDAPGDDWTVPRLAARVGQSRSAFYRAFTASVGVSPGAYLLRWRITVAQHRLLEGAPSLDALATALGYRSAAAFSRAFKQRTGMAPRHWLRARGALMTGGTTRYRPVEEPMTP